jgi:hypothetical protein
MSRGTLPFCAILIAACFASAPSPAASGGASPLNAATCSDGTTFISHVSLLAANYDPSNFGTPPVGGTSDQLTPQEKTDLNAAFNAAPPRFQKALCNLDGIYVDPSNVYSWGFRDIYTGGTYRYIGLSQQSLWGSNGQSPAPKYSGSETSLIQQVLATIGAPWPNPTSKIPNPPRFSQAKNVSNPTAMVDTSAMTVLAALAHEYGHILWFDLVKGSRWYLFYDPAAFCRKDRNTPGDGFFDNSWQMVHQPNIYITFAGLPSPQDLHFGTIQTQGLLTAINQQQWSTAVDDLNAYYSPDTSTNPNGVWPSLFGSISPAEDFVETFKIFVMTRPETNNGLPITSMPLNLFATANSAPTYSPDIYAYVSSMKKLKNKIACIHGKW